MHRFLYSLFPCASTSYEFCFQQQSLCMYIQLDMLTYSLALRITIHGRDTGIMQEVLVAVFLGATSSV